MIAMHFFTSVFLGIHTMLLFKTGVSALLISYERITSGRIQLRCSILVGVMPAMK